MTLINTPSNHFNSPTSAIPSPSHPKQYRAIGVIRGRYKPLEQVLTKGTLLSLSGQNIDAVLLAKTISVVKNHVNLNQNQYWIVYPHTCFEQNNSLHAQIVGVWQPNSYDENQIIFADDFFSIRGEVVYCSRKEETVIVKIYGNKSVDKNQSSFFKLQLKGKIPDNTVKHFYDFNVVLKGSDLIIQQYIDLGFIAVRYNYSKTKKMPNNLRNKDNIPKYKPKNLD